MRSGERTKPRLAEEGSGLVGLIFGLGLLALVLFGNDDPVDAASRTLASVALGAVYCLPGVLALLGRRRPALYLATGLLGILAAFTSLGGAGLPLLIPAVMGLVAYGRHIDEARGRVAAPLVALIATVLGIASFAALFLFEDPRCMSTSNAAECSSNVVVPAEALASLGLWAAAVLAGWTLARPERS